MKSLKDIWKKETHRKKTWLYASGIVGRRMSEVVKSAQEVERLI